MAYLNFDPTTLADSAVQHRKELLRIPLLAAESVLKHMTAVPGVQGKMIVGSLSGDIALAPYSATRYDEDGVAITGRTLETFLGSVIKRFDVNLAARSVYGAAVTQGCELAETDLAYQVLAYLAAKLGENLANEVWNGVRNPEGTSNGTLFDGFWTLLENPHLPEHVINVSNILKPDVAGYAGVADALIKFFMEADPILQDHANKLFLPISAYNKYILDYRDTWGASPYNTEFKKTFLEGTDNRVELVPVKVPYNGDFPQLILTSQANMLYGYGDGLAEEKITIEKHHPFLLDFVASMFFGVEFANTTRQAMAVSNYVNA